ncbi:MAG: DegT/DnrJ/EryC1/StrS family aminotransferase, partial [Anaerolineales bacterium]
GLPADMPSILHIGRCYQLPVLEDACQANGARCLIDGRWQRVGSFGAAAVFSFSPSETKGAGREAGAVVTSDPGIASKIRWLRDRSSQGSCSRQSGSTSLESRQAAALAEELGTRDEMNRRRRRAADGYREVLAGLPLSLPIEPEFAEHIYDLYVVRASDRDLLHTELAEAGVSAALYDNFPPHMQERLQQHGYVNGDFPAFERWTATVLSLPMHPNLPPSQIQHIGAACRKILGTHAPNW